MQIAGGVREYWGGIVPLVWKRFRFGYLFANVEIFV